MPGATKKDRDTTSSATSIELNVRVAPGPRDTFPCLHTRGEFPCRSVVCCIYCYLHDGSCSTISITRKVGSPFHISVPLEKSMTTAQQPTQLLAELKTAFEGITQTAAALSQAIENEAAATPDLPGVKRLSGNSLSVSSSKLFASGSWSQFGVDAPAQAGRIGEIIGDILAKPATAIKQIEAILSTGEEPARLAGVKHIYDATVVDRFRPVMLQALETGKALQAFQTAFPNAAPDKGSRP